MLAYLGHLWPEPHHGTINLNLGFAVQAVARWDILIWFGVRVFRMECSSIPVWYFIPLEKV